MLLFHRPSDTADQLCAGSQARSDSYLFGWEKNTFIEMNNGLNLRAYYYVYDAEKLSAGQVNTTAILNFEYY